MRPTCPTCHRAIPKPRQKRDPLSRYERFFHELGIAFAFGVQWPWPYAGSKVVAPMDRIFRPMLLRVGATGDDETLPCAPYLAEHDDGEALHDRREAYTGTMEP